MVVVNNLKNKNARAFRSFSKAVGAQPSFEEYILGDGNGRVRDPDDDNLWLVRKSDDAPVESVPWLMLGMFPTTDGTGVVVGWHMGQRGIYSANYRQMVAANNKPNLYNTGDTALQGWFSKKGYPSLICKAIGTYTTPSTIIMVEAADWIDEENIYRSFTRGQVDAVSSIPTSGLARLVLIVILPDLTLMVIEGSTRSAGIQLFPTHIQQVIENKPPRSIPLAIYRLVGGQTSVTEADKVGDMRELLNTQIPPRMNWSGTTDPDVTDDSDSGYGFGSFWRNGTTPQTFICDDATPGAAVWTPMGASGAPADATYITQTPSSDLSNEQALSALATGDMVNTTTTGVITVLKANRVATTDPGVSDDNTAGYAPGSRWLNLTGAREYVNLSNGTGAALWLRTGAKNNFGTSTNSDPTVTDDDAAKYSVGSIWVNRLADTVWMCTDNSTGAALWKQLTGVTSVGLTMPSELSVSGSPVTGSGSFTVSWANQSANTGFFGPTTGSPAAPAFRALVNLDIPVALSGKAITDSTFEANSLIQKRVLTANLTVPDTYCLVLADYLKINTGVTLTLAGDAELRLT